MSKKRYVVRLSKSEWEERSSLIKRGKHKVSALRRRHARVLLKVDQGKRGPSWSDVRTGEALEIHYTPKHGSWLNIAEIEQQVLSRQCLDRRIDTRDELDRGVHAWTEHRNDSITGVDWQFTSAKARTKLKRRYPEFTS